MFKIQSQAYRNITCESENVQEALDKIEQDRFSAFIEVFEVLQDVANRLLNSDTSLDCLHLAVIFLKLWKLLNYYTRS